MKKLTLILIGVIFSILTFGQVYYTFPDTNAIWNSKYDGYYGSHKERFGLYGDTTIDEQVYKKVYRIVDDSTLNLNNMTYYATIRENDTKQIFVRLAYEDLEILLYDFSLNIGDTVNSNSPYGYLNYDICVIADIDSIEVENNQYRKRYKINDWGLDYWIEGIGSVDGLFNPIMEYIIGTYCDLLCFKENDTAVYINNPECDKCFCTLLTPVEEKEKVKDFITIYPNPTTNDLTIEFKQEKGIATIRLFNSHGKQLEVRESNSFPIKMNIDYLPIGIYLIQIDSENKTLNKKLIKIE
jgi:hypothetical protein